MTHPELVNLVLGIHSPILLACLAAYYRFGDHSGVQIRALESSKRAREKLKREISASLGDKLEPIFSDPGSIVQVTMLYGPDDKPYREVNVSPAGSEKYREAIFDFVLQDGDSMADYRDLHTLISTYMRWFKRRSWLIIALLIWQAIAVGTLLLVEKILAAWLPAPGIGLSLLPTGLIVTSCLVSLVALQHTANRIIDLRRKYDLS